MNKQLRHTTIAATIMLLSGKSAFSEAPIIAAALQPQAAAAPITPTTPTTPPKEHQNATAQAIVTKAAQSTGSTETPISQPGETNTDEATIAARVLLTINGQPITVGMLDAYLGQRMQNMPNIKPSPELQNMILEELVNTTLLAQVARANHMDSYPEVLTTLNIQRDMLLAKMVLHEHMSKLTPDETQLQQAYDSQYGTIRPEYKASHILVPTEAEAKALIDQLAKGADFAVLAKEKSKDPNSKRGGDLGWFEASQMVKQFSDEVATMKVGATSTAPVQTQFGWHVVKLEDKRMATQPTFAAVKSRLLTDWQRSTLSDYVEQLRKQAKIDVMSANVTPEPAVETVK